MNKIVITIVIVIVLLLTSVFIGQRIFINVIPAEGPATTPADIKIEEKVEMPTISTIAENLTIPWDIVFLPNGNLLIPERSGDLIEINPESGEVYRTDVQTVVHKGEGGLLGIVAHPDFARNNYLYIYTTSSLDGSSVNNVDRFNYKNGELTGRKKIVENIPGSLFHNGGRIAFGPDGLLYIATGDARNPDSAQDKDILSGKILRLGDDGSIPTDNPFGNEVYSYGHRNPQGLTWDELGRLWSTEHGRTTATKTGLDEVNLIKRGGNYGWPDSEGDTVLAGTIAPVAHSGPDVTWAPASAAYLDGSIFFGGLRGETLYEAVISNESIVEIKEHFAGIYRRIRVVIVGPGGALYITTSNRDGRGDVAEGDDRVIRLDLSVFR